MLKNNFEKIDHVYVRNSKTGETIQVLVGDSLVVKNNLYQKQEPGLVYVKEDIGETEFEIVVCYTTPSGFMITKIDQINGNVIQRTHQD